MFDGHHCAPDRAKGVANLILDVGKPTFDRAYADYLRTYANVREYMVVAYRRTSKDAPRALMSSSPELPLLYRAVFYKQDPNRPILLDAPSQGEIIAFPSLLDEHYSSLYKQSIFQSNGIIDKFGTACWAGDVCYYINYYRMDGELPFSEQDREELLDVSDLISKLIARQFEGQDGAANTSSPLSEEILGPIVRELSPGSPLTEREVQVCTLILMGCSSEAIALRLGIAVNSVLTYRRRAYERLGIVSQNELFAKVLVQFSASHLGWQ